MITHNSQDTFNAINPATGKAIDPPYSISSLDQVNLVCAAAAKSFDAYRTLTNESRATFLETIGKEIMALGDSLLERAMSETGLPLARLTGERGRTVNQLNLFAKTVRAGYWQDLRIDPAMPDRQPLPRSDLRMRKIPIGPVAVFGASNFPLAFSTAGGDTASALAAGCPVIVKGHPAHPGTDEMVAGAILKAAAQTGMPEGVFGHIRGPANELGAALVSDPRITGVGFTGSRAGGLALVNIAQSRPVPIPVYAEMSSINPVILMPNALKRRGAELGKSFIQSLTMGAGQFCTNPGLVISLESEGLEAFTESATVTLASHEPQTMLTGGICEAFKKGTDLLAHHASVQAIGASITSDKPTSGQARLFTTSAQSFLTDNNLGHEVFGASSLIIICDDMAEIAAVLEQLEGQLTATLQMDTEDGAAAAQLIPILERKAGRILANGWPTGVEVCDAMVHGGPFPATSDSRTTSVGTLAIDRFLRPVCYQDLPDILLPESLKDDSKYPKMIDGNRA